MRSPLSLIPHPDSFTSRLRGAEIASRVGLWLGVCFFVAFVTGLISHAAQDQPGWLTFPTRPVSLYRITQGVHVISGTAAVPLLLVKLWSVFPKLFDRFDFHNIRRLALQLAERLSIALLVSAAIFQLVTGLANSAQWYPWAFSFRSTHYAVAWIAIGALILHIAVKLPVIRQALGGPLDDDVARTGEQGLSRRGFLRTTWVATGVAVLTTAGATVPWLRDISIFGVRSGDGPAGIPINVSAAAARVVPAATDPAYRLEIVNGDKQVMLTRADLGAMEQTKAVLPIACVEGWSASGEWAGVLVRDLLALVEAAEDADVAITSLQKRGTFRQTTMPAHFAQDSLTLLALELNGEGLSIDHGHPCRIIAPTRPGVLQTKWVARIQVLA
ncbi:MAG: molybdopterin-dependent oxidoreductase [Actinomycetota bacterium]|nr:molybdopterin-dependent oxidoreductase [Actinomycetota bacterium]